MDKDAKVTAGFAGHLRARLNQEEQRRSVQKAAAAPSPSDGPEWRPDMDYSREERLQAMSRAVRESRPQSVPGHSFNMDPTALYLQSFQPAMKGGAPVVAASMASFRLATPASPAPQSRRSLNHEQRQRGVLDAYLTGQGKPSTVMTMRGLSRGHSVPPQAGQEMQSVIPFSVIPQAASIAPVPVTTRGGSITPLPVTTRGGSITPLPVGHVPVLQQPAEVARPPDAARGQVFMASPSMTLSPLTRHYLTAPNGGSVSMSAGHPASVSFAATTGASVSISGYAGSVATATPGASVSMAVRGGSVVTATPGASVSVSAGTPSVLSPSPLTSRGGSVVLRAAGPSSALRAAGPSSARLTTINSARSPAPLPAPLPAPPTQVSVTLPAPLPAPPTQVSARSSLPFPRARSSPRSVVRHTISQTELPAARIPLVGAFGQRVASAALVTAIPAIPGNNVRPESTRPPVVTLPVPLPAPPEQAEALEPNDQHLSDSWRAFGLEAAAADAAADEALGATTLMLLGAISQPRQRSSQEQPDVAGPKPQADVVCRDLGETPREPATVALSVESSPLLGPLAVPSAGATEETSRRVEGSSGMLLGRAAEARVSLMEEVEKTRAIIKRLQNQAEGGPTLVPLTNSRVAKNAESDPRGQQKATDDVMSTLRSEVDRVHKELMLERERFETWQSTMSQKLSLAMSPGLSVGKPCLAPYSIGGPSGNAKPGDEDAIQQAWPEMADKGLVDRHVNGNSEVAADAFVGPFYSKACGSNTSISPDGYAARRTRGVRQSVVVGSTPLKRQACGSLYFEVVINETMSGMVGGLGIGMTHSAPGAQQSPPDGDEARSVPSSFIVGYEGHAYLGPREWNTPWQPEGLLPHQRVGCLVTGDAEPCMVVLVDGTPVVKVDHVALIDAGFVEDAPLYPVVDVYSATLAVRLAPSARPLALERIKSFAEGADINLRPTQTSEVLTDSQSGPRRSLANGWAQGLAAASEGLAAAAQQQHVDQDQDMQSLARTNSAVIGQDPRVSPRMSSRTSSPPLYGRFSLIETTSAA